jgi:D-glycero-beta-D-manno-heptose 1-phosphate adenylyltransferase
MQALRKVIPYEGLAEWRADLETLSRPLIVTNGCFDLLHAGHVFFLENARALGKTLLVGVNSDWAIQTLKGPGRPVMPERDRLMMLSSVEAVSKVCLFPEVDAMAFLATARPDIYVKGGDYTVDTINQRERRLLEEQGTRIEILPRFELQSSSAILRRIVEAAGPA